MIHVSPKWRKLKRLLSAWIREAVLVISGAAGPLRCPVTDDALHSREVVL